MGKRMLLGGGAAVVCVLAVGLASAGVFAGLVMSGRLSF